MKSSDLEPLIKRVGTVLVDTSKGPWPRAQTAANNGDVGELADILHDFLHLQKKTCENWEANAAQLRQRSMSRAYGACVLHSSPEQQLSLALGVLKDATPSQIAALLTLDTIGFLESQLVLAGKIVARESAPTASCWCCNGTDAKCPVCKPAPPSITTRET